MWTYIVVFPRRCEAARNQIHQCACIALASASGAPKAAAPETPERPLVALDYHHTIEFNQTVNEVTIRHLQDIQRWGYDLIICSFSSNTTTHAGEHPQDLP